MELNLIEYFENQKALDYESGIYINKMPKEYDKSFTFLLAKQYAIYIIPNN